MVAGENPFRCECLAKDGAFRVGCHFCNGAGSFRGKLPILDFVEESWRLALPEEVARIAMDGFALCLRIWCLRLLRLLNWILMDLAGIAMPSLFRF